MAPMHCASSWRRWRARAAMSKWMNAASRAIATSRPSCGTPRVSASRTASVRSTTLRAPKATLAVNKWIIGEVVETLAKLDKAFAEFRFDGMADTIYHFTWDTFLRLVSGTDQAATSMAKSRNGRGVQVSQAGCSTRSLSCSTPSCPLSPKNCGMRSAPAIMT